MLLIEEKMGVKHQQNTYTSGESEYEECCNRNSMCVSVTFLIYSIMFALICLIGSATLLSQRESSECYIKSCDVVEKRCTTNTFEFLCYTEDIKYTFVYNDVEYEYEYENTVYSDLQIANETCNGLYKQNSTMCYFYRTDIQGTVSLVDMSKTLVAVLIIGIVLFVLLMIIIIVIVICPEKGNGNKKGNSKYSKINTFPMDQVA